MRLTHVRGAVAIGIAGLTFGATAAYAKATIAPYIELQQVIDTEFGNGGRTDPSTTATVGFDASINNRRFEGQASYQYQHNFFWNGGNDTDHHSGLARLRGAIIPDLLTVDGGALAFQTRYDSRLPDGSLSGNGNRTQVYGFYGGPTLHTEAGALQFDASYRAGYSATNAGGGAIALPVGQVQLNRFDSSTSHDFLTSVGMPVGHLPFGWSIIGSYSREDAAQLDQRFDDRVVRGEVEFPVGPSFALLGGLGYERISIQQRAPLLVGGLPVFDSAGRFVTDPTSPLLSAFFVDGAIWDVGFRWRPDRRLTLQVRGGERYGDMAVIGSLQYQLSPRSALNVGIFNGIESFGRSVRRELSAMPTSFNVTRDPITGDFGSCFFGVSGGGSCLGDSLQSAVAANYRSKGAFAVLSGRRGHWNFGLGGTYSQREYLAPASSGLFSLEGVVDKSMTVQADLTRALSSSSSVTGMIYGTIYNSGLPGSSRLREVGMTAYYSRSFTRHLSGFGGARLSNSHGAGTEHTYGQVSAGLRYRF